MRKITYRQAINEAIREEMRRDPNVIIMGEDIAGGAGRERQGIIDPWGGALGTTKGLITEFGSERVLDTPISESGFIGTAVGAAVTGLRPIVELMFVDFLGVCFDQIYNQAGKLRYMFGGGDVKVPMTIKTMMGAGLRAAGNHSQTLYSLFAHMPGLKVVVPSTPYDMKGLLISSIRDDDPVIVFEHKTLYNVEGEVPEESYTIPLGKADIKRQGKDVTVVAISRMVHTALEATDKLVKEGIEIEVIDPRTLSPLDEETILISVKKTGHLVVVDEDNPRCSIARDIAGMVAEKGFEYLDAPVRCVTAPHTSVPFSPPLEDHYIPAAGKIVTAVREISG